jgi:hypothetical protein
MTPAAQTFDPWTSTIEQARRAANSNPNALAQWETAQRVRKARETCLGADGGLEVMQCIKLCGNMGLTLPRWLSDEYTRRHDLVTGAQVGTWDAAFGKPWPPRVRLASVRAALALQTRVHAAVWSLIESDRSRSIGRDLFDEIGQLPGIHRSGATVERAYYKALAAGKPNAVAIRLRGNPRLSDLSPSIDFLIHRIKG